MLASTTLTKQLPVASFCHSHNYSSDGGWLAYQVSVDEVRLINYNPTLTITQGFVFKFAPEPIKQVKLIVDQNQSKVYLAICFLTKYVIYQGNTELCSYRLKLDKNIVVFGNSFVSCDAFNDSKQIYFTFLTAQGEIYVVSVDNIGMKSVVNVPAQDRFCSIKVLDQNVVVGNEKGKVFLVDMNNSSILKSFDTGSHMPILHLGWVCKRVIAITCQGEIFNLSENLTKFTALSAHQAMISHMNIGNDRLYTFGDDCVLNSFELDKNTSDLKLRRSEKFTKRANMIVTLYNITLVNFYEENALTEVN